MPQRRLGSVFLALGCLATAAHTGCGAEPNEGGSSEANATEAGLKDDWGPLVQLRDNTGTFADKPPGGWFVTPIHTTLLANGNVLVTGWSRRDQSDCGHGGSRRNGTTFVLDPAQLATAGATLDVAPLDERGQPSSDVLYCSGHAPTSDGRIFYTGGSRYQNLGEPNQIEQGINYGRLFDPQTSTFARVPKPMLGGPAGLEGTRWYPTMTRLDDSRVLVTGGFTACCESKFANPSVEIFDPRESDKGNAPWRLLVPIEEGPSDLTTTLSDYPHVVLLPKPVVSPKNGPQRQLAMLGRAGNMLFFDYKRSSSGTARFDAPPGGRRGATADGATTALVASGDIAVIGGSEDPAVARRADFYNPTTDSWSRLDTGIGRYHPTSVLLPDGEVLVLNGEAKSNFSGDRRKPQSIDPVARKVTTLTAEPIEADRGYHNFALLLKDGRVLVGGGTQNHHGIGCERPDLRIYSPPYISSKNRPTIEGFSEPAVMRNGGTKLPLTFKGPPLRAKNGVVLMATGSMTHGFNQNQRIIPLQFDVKSTGSIEIAPPANASVAPPGDYILFVVSQTGVPSVGKHVRVVSDPIASLAQVRNETNTPEEAQFCKLQFPLSFSVRAGQPATIFGRIFQDGLTQPQGQDGRIMAEVGTGPLGSDPTTQPGWTFQRATFNVQVGNDDEYSASIKAPATSTSIKLAYTYRFSLDGGKSFTYCDTNGAGSNQGQAFESDKLGVMTVDP